VQENSGEVEQVLVAGEGEQSVSSRYPRPADFKRVRREGKSPDDYIKIMSLQLLRAN
jgi:hypothetical protein